MPEQQFICDFSGFKFPISEGVRNWDGMFVHRRYADKRNPQDFVRGVPDRQNVQISRVEPPDVFQDTPVSPSDL